MKKHHAKKTQHKFKSIKKTVLKLFKNKKWTKKTKSISKSLRSFMNKNEKLTVLAVGVGALVLIGFSVYLIFNRTNVVNNEEVLISPTPEKRITTPYPTVPQEIEQATVIINSRAILPSILNIVRGGTVSFYNEGESAVTIEAYTQQSEILNLGEIPAGQMVKVTFENSGVYEYLNPENPNEIANIIVE